MFQTNITSTSLLAREMKIRTLQYKVTIFLVAFFLFVLRPQITDIVSGFNNAKDGYKSVVETHMQREQQHKIVLKDIELLQKISNDSQRASLIQCYNADCKTLPDEIKTEPVKSAVKAYLQLQQSTNTKFTIDQKKVLAYLNEFLVKTPDWAAYNGIIESISFGGASKNDKNSVVEIPVSLTMKFPNKQWLLWFLRNIEKYISPTFPMLSIVQSVNYDIVNAESAQEVTVTINIYMLD